MQQLEKALILKSELDTLRPIDKEREAIIMQKFRLDWNYHSNHLEGNTLTFGETKALLLFGITAQGKPLKDHIEISGHNEAINWVIDIVKEGEPMTEYFIRHLHILLLKEPYEVEAITPEGLPTRKMVEIGKYKTTPNHVKTKTGEIFRFATPEETPARMHDLIDWYRAECQRPDVNPILLAAEFHYKFIRIHPFDDGNGRTARILMNMILMQFGYPPVIIKTEDKVNYFAALQQADSGMYEPFFEYIAQNLVRSLEIMIAGAKGENIEEPDDLDKEIALLEQKLKTVGKKIEVAKSQEAILEIYDDSIARLCRKFIEACEKFDRFYMKNGFSINVNGNYVSSHKNEAFLNIRNTLKIETNTQSINLEYWHQYLNREGLGQFTHQSKISIDFELGIYVLILPDALKPGDPITKNVIKKFYNEQLTDDEINKLIRIETTRHKDLIEKKLSEAK